MTKAEPLAAQSAANDESVEAIRQDAPSNHLRDAVTASVRQYLSELDGQMTTDFYDMVLSQIEEPLLEVCHHQNFGNKMQKHATLLSRIQWIPF